MSRSYTRFIIGGVSLLAAATSQVANSALGNPIQGNTGIGAANLAVIVNDSDLLSVKIGQYYKLKRHIPDSNMIHVHFRPGTSTLNRTEFEKIKEIVDKVVPAKVEAYALAWTQPYRVERMSVTTAFAAGFDEKFCSPACGPTKPSPYYNSYSGTPYTDYHWRPAMALAGRDFEEVKKLIDRGVASDHTFPHGTGYLVSTTDKARNVRVNIYSDIVESYFGS